MKKKYVSNRPLGARDSAGIGYLIIPSDQERKQYVEHCYRTGTVTIALENGGLINDVLITKSALNNIDFPDKFNELGTIFVWINQPRKNQPIIIGSLSKTNEFVSFNSDKSSLRRSSNGFVSEVIVDSKKGILIINSNSSKGEGGDIYVISTNRAEDDNKKSKLVVRVSGNIDVSSRNFTLENSKKLLLRVKDLDDDDNVTEIGYEKSVGFSYKDEFGNEAILNSENIQFSPNSKFNIGDGKEPMVLGDTFKDILDDLTDIVSDLATASSQITVVASSFGAPTSVPANAASFVLAKTKLTTLKEKYKNFQSKKSFTD